MALGPVKEEDRGELQSAIGPIMESWGKLNVFPESAGVFDSHCQEAPQ